jgi:hypothetical protein
MVKLKYFEIKLFNLRSIVLQVPEMCIHIHTKYDGTDAKDKFVFYKSSNYILCSSFVQI